MKNEVLLQATNITKRYGGLLANQNVNITLERGKLHALLGPNGAGKSTCINMLSGDAQPSSGKIEFQNKDITNLTSWQRSQVGIGRSYGTSDCWCSLVYARRPCSTSKSP